MWLSIHHPPISDTLWLQLPPARLFIMQTRLIGGPSERYPAPVNYSWSYCVQSWRWSVLLRHFHTHVQACVRVCGRLFGWPWFRICLTYANFKIARWLLLQHPRSNSLSRSGLRLQLCLSASNRSRLRYVIKASLRQHQTLFCWGVCYHVPLSSKLWTC